MTGNQNRTHVGTASVVVVLSALLATVGTAKAGALSIEEHTYHAQVTPTDFGEGYSTSVSIPYFDTLGGTRQLEEVWFEWGLSFEWEAEIGSPLTDANAQMQWTTEWSAEIPGGLQVPTSSTVSLISDHWLANDGGAPPYTESGTDFVIGNETVSSLSYLTALTGVGSFSMEHFFNVSSINVSDPGEPGFDFDPNIAQVFGLSLYVDGTVEYRYSDVPAPASLPLLCAAFARMSRRRRRF